MVDKKEKYQPSEEETKKAERMMTNAEKELSETREWRYITEKEKEREEFETLAKQATESSKRMIDIWMENLMGKEWKERLLGSEKKKDYMDLIHNEAIREGHERDAEEKWRLCFALMTFVFDNVFLDVEGFTANIAPDEILHARFRGSKAYLVRRRAKMSRDEQSVKAWEDAWFVTLNGRRIKPSKMDPAELERLASILEKHHKDDNVDIIEVNEDIGKGDIPRIKGLKKSLAATTEKDRLLEEEGEIERELESHELDKEVRDPFIKTDKKKAERLKKEFEEYRQKRFSEAQE